MATTDNTNADRMRTKQLITRLETPIKVGVVGDVSSGKSSFINSLGRIVLEQNEHWPCHTGKNPERVTTHFVLRPLQPIEREAKFILIDTPGVSIVGKISIQDTIDTLIRGVPNGMTIGELSNQVEKNEFAEAVPENRPDVFVIVVDVAQLYEFPMLRGFFSFLYSVKVEDLVIRELFKEKIKGIYDQCNKIRMQSCYIFLSKPDQSATKSFDLAALRLKVIYDLGLSNESVLIAPLYRKQHQNRIPVLDTEIWNWLSRLLSGMV